MQTKSKGERLNWDSLKQAKKVKLSDVLKEGKEVTLNNLKPLLLP